MQVSRNPVTTIITLTPTSEENEVIEWIISKGSTKFRIYLENYIEQRRRQMHAEEEQTIGQQFRNLSAENRAFIIAEIIARQP